MPKQGNKSLEKAMRANKYTVESEICYHYETVKANRYGEMSKNFVQLIKNNISSATE